MLLGPLTIFAWYPSSAVQDKFLCDNKHYQTASVSCGFSAPMPLPIYLSQPPLQPAAPTPNSATTPSVSDINARSSLRTCLCIHPPRKEHMHTGQNGHFGHKTATHTDIHIHRIVNQVLKTSFIRYDTKKLFPQHAP